MNDDKIIDSIVEIEAKRPFFPDRAGSVVRFRFRVMKALRIGALDVLPGDVLIWTPNDERRLYLARAATNVDPAEIELAVKSRALVVAVDDGHTEAK
jgi:hypothetical protein